MFPGSDREDILVFWQLFKHGFVLMLKSGNLQPRMPVGVQLACTSKTHKEDLDEERSWELWTTFQSAASERPRIRLVRLYHFESEMALDLISEKSRSFHDRSPAAQIYSAPLSGLFLPLEPRPDFDSSSSSSRHSEGQAQVRRPEVPFSFPLSPLHPQTLKQKSQFSGWALLNLSSQFWEDAPCW